MAFDLKKILLCIDAEKHSVKAEEFAIEIAKRFGAKLVCLYVVDAYPKIFTNEIYAINRNECREHLDRAQAKEGLEAFKYFEKLAEDAKINYQVKMRYGFREEEILKEIEEGDYDLIVLGRKRFKGYLDRIRSFNLPKKIFEKTHRSIVFISGE